MKMSRALGVLSFFTSGMVACVALTSAANPPTTLPIIAAPPATVPAADVKRLLKCLASDDWKTRERATLLVKNLPGESFPFIEEALRGRDLEPDVKRALDVAIPLVRARANMNDKHLQVVRWLQKILAAGYKRAGIRDPRWDKDVASALNEWGRSCVGGLEFDHYVRCAEAFKHIVDEGCDDSMMEFLASRTAHVLKTFDQAAGNVRLQVALKRVFASEYPADCQLLAILQATRGMDSISPEIVKHVKTLLPETLKQSSSLTDPMSSTVGGFFFSRSAAILNKAEGIESSFNFCEPIFRGAYPKEVGPLAIRVKYMIDWAWQARGGDWASKVTDEGWKLFGDRLKMAHAAGEAAWRLDPTDGRCASNMIWVAIGQGGNPDEMEKWFARGMEWWPDNYELCKSKLQYLWPRWHGSHEEMLTFAHECLATGNWYGRLTFIPVDTHLQIASEAANPAKYWKDPKIWDDVKAVYGTYFELYKNPAIDERAFYARLSADCEHWDVADEQFKKIGDKPFRGDIFPSPMDFLMKRMQAAIQNGSERPPADFTLPDGRVLTVSQDGHRVDVKYPKP